MLNLASLAPFARLVCTAFLSLALCGSASALIFKSDRYTAHWDTWVYHHDGTYFLYYLITEGSTGEGYGVASSDDGVHWTDHGMQIEQSDKNVHYLGTGSVWMALDPSLPGKFICNYSEHRRVNGRNQQNILFAYSDDLITWTKFPDSTIFRPDPENGYAEFGRWDCIFTFPRPEGGYYGTWTANGAEKKGTIGIGYSLDGLNWKTLPAPDVEPGVGESGAMYDIDGQIYAMLGRHNMYSYRADTIEGPYTASPKNYEIIMRPHTYFCRFLPSPDGLLANHHQMSGTRLEQTPLSRRREITYVSPFKKVWIDDEQIMRWMWWEGNEALRGEPTEAATHDFNVGIIVEADLTFPTEKDVTAITFDSYNRHYTVRVLHDGRVEFGETQADGSRFRRVHEVDRDWKFDPSAKLRVLARAGMMEVYLDDHFMESWTMGCHGARDVSVRPTTPDRLTDLRVWTMDLPEAKAPLREPFARVRDSIASSNADPRQSRHQLADDDLGTRWISSGLADSEWIEFSTEQAFVPKRATIHWGENRPAAFLLEFKDGRKWRTLYQGKTTESTQRLIFKEAARTRNFRVSFETKVGAPISIYELQIHAE